MKGKQHIIVSNRDAKFKFDLNRNITIVRGNSGTGKTTLYNMIVDYTRLGEKSGVNLSSTKKCVALTDINWKNQLESIEDSIVFIDEGAEYIKSKEFAHQIKNSNNYYVIFNRENLHELPYSVNEIYEIKKSGKYHLFKPVYKSKKHLYYLNKNKPQKKYNALLTEDSKSGFQFYENYFKESDIHCNTSVGNSNIYGWLKEHSDEKTIVIVDGAAFGSQIDKVLKLKSSIHFDLYCPESFEWLILKSGLIKTRGINELLEQPEAYIESLDYFSWEKFFEKYLIDITLDSPYAYSKANLAEVYYHRHNAEKIIAELFEENNDF